MRRKVNFRTPRARKIDSLRRKIYEIDMELDREATIAQDVEQLRHHKAALESEIETLKNQQNEPSRMV